MTVKKGEGFKILTKKLFIKFSFLIFDDYKITLFLFINFPQKQVFSFKILFI